MHYFGAMTDWKTYHPLLLALCAVFCLTAAWNFTPLFFLIVPAWILLLHASTQWSKPLLWLYVVFALWNGATTYWIANAHPLGVIATVGINGFLMALALWFGRRSQQMVLRLGAPKWLGWTVVIAAWMAFEHLHEYWGLAFPWLHLGNTFYAWPQLVQWYEYIGTSGGTLWVLVLAILWYRPTRLWIRLLVTVVPVGLSLILFYMPNEVSKERIKVAVVQPNIDAYTEKWSMPERTQIRKVERLLTESGAENVDLLVLPETFLPKAREEQALGRGGSDRLMNETIEKFAKSALFGTTTYDFQEEKSVYNRPMGDRFYTLYNSALFKPSQTPYWQVYHKGKLVVGGETMPFVRYLQPLLGDWAIALGGTSGTLGVSEERKVFEDLSTGVKLAPIICWENEFSGYAVDYARQGANLLAVITNDGWWGNTDGHVQHMHFAGLRAIEQRKYVVRSANTGISTIINEKGVPQERLEWEEEGVIIDTVPLLEGQTVYVKTGNFLGPLATLITLLTVVVVLISRFFRIRP